MTGVFVASISLLLLTGHRMLFPGRSPFDRVWRWAKDAHIALRSDRRAPILLLRSFADEALSTAERSSDFGSSVEVAIARPVAGRGPFIAIGIPGEATPAGRAYRAYLTDADWQIAVLDWMYRSQLIVVILGRTPWVRWELETLQERGYLSPDHASGYSPRTLK